MACAMNASKLVSPMDISVALDQVNTMYVDENKNFKFEKIIISDWPFKKISCEKCSIQFDRHRFPQGPESVVKVFDHKQDLKLLVIDAKRRFKKVGDWKFSLNKDNNVEGCFDDTCSILKAGETVTVKGCNIYLPWLAITPGQLGIADSASNHFQAIVACP